jgi:hypothetical protein
MFSATYASGLSSLRNSSVELKAVVRLTYMVKNRLVLAIISP